MIIGSLLVAACGGSDAAQSFDSIEEMGAVIVVTMRLVPNDRSRGVGRSTVWGQAVGGALGVATGGPRRRCGVEHIVGLGHPSIPNIVSDADPSLCEETLASFLSGPSRLG